MDWVNTALSIIAGLSVTIPLVIKLIEYVQKAAREKNWNAMLQMVLRYMQEAETMFETGADKKEWVLAMVKASSETVNYDIDMSVVSRLIDELCNMSKVVNAPVDAPIEKAAE